MRKVPAAESRFSLRLFRALTLPSCVLLGAAPGLHELQPGQPRAALGWQLRRKRALRAAIDRAGRRGSHGVRASRWALVHWLLEELTRR